MGYRSTFVSSHIDITWPEWFFLKYHKTVFFSTDFNGVSRGVIASRSEGKFYSPGVGLYGELLADLAKIPDVVNCSFPFSIAVMHEDNLIDRFTFKDGQVLKHQHDEVDNPQTHVTY